MPELIQILIMLAVPASVFAYIGFLNRRSDRLYYQNSRAETAITPSARRP